MKKSYGEVIIKKDSILYHISDEPFEIRNNKPMLFCTFHPSEWDVMNDYITFVKIKKDISLLFMIEECKKAKIFSSLPLFSNHPNLNLSKKHLSQLSCYAMELKKENLYGWMTSIENKSSIEICLINNLNLYNIVSIEKLKRDWRNGNEINGEKKLKNWGNSYPICTIERPITLLMNDRFREMIEKYKQYEITSGYFREHVFQILLNNCIINYYKADLEKIEWKC